MKNQKTKLIEFSTIDELYNQAKNDGAFISLLNFIKMYNTIDELLHNCPKNYMLWAIDRKYAQFCYYFIEHIEKYNDERNFNLLDLLFELPELSDRFYKWDVLGNTDWLVLLNKHPQIYSKYTVFNRFDVIDWVILLTDQPQFADKCEIFDEFTKYYWVCLLYDQPKLADKCTKFDEFSMEDWAIILKNQPQLEIYRTNLITN